MNPSQKLKSALVDRDVNAQFKFNQETEFIPIAGLIEENLNSDPAETVNASASSIQANHHTAILALLAEELSITSEKIHDFEL